MVWEAADPIVLLLAVLWERDIRSAGLEGFCGWRYFEREDPIDEEAFARRKENRGREFQ